MHGRVIQGFFIDGRMRPPASAGPVGMVQRVVAGGPAVPAARPGPPAPAFARGGGSVQARPAPGHPAYVHAARARPIGGSDNFEIDPAQIGLARSGGGQPLPQAVLAKMEAAFGADFSAVRVHVGPQASRIGALAFTTGNDLYFAPGQFQPDSVTGQQLIGHELAHVIQQRRGRVRAPRTGVAVVQDRSLEAEADRLGMRAAAHVLPVQPKRAAGFPAAATAPGGIPDAPPIQCAPAGLGAVVQLLQYGNSKPVGAKGSVTRFQIDGKKYLENSRRTRWYWHSGGHWVKIKRGKVPTYNRFQVGRVGRGGPRAGSFASRIGSGASYSDTRRRTGPSRSSLIVPISAPSRSRRTYRANMRVATRNEGIFETDSATQYAAHFNAPVIGGGYNWCHLVGHGGGGSDRPDNIVAASTHANSEQLEIERITYQYKQKGVGVRARAILETGSQYLAKTIVVEVFFNNDLIYSRAIDAYRADKPSWIELAGVEVRLSRAIYEATE